jgi:hypothetical protein
MDVSKLPRLSKTQTPPPSDAAPLASPEHSEYRAPLQTLDPIGVGAEVWFAVIVGLILMALGRTYAQYELGRLTRHPYHTHVNWTEWPMDGQEVGYPDLEGLDYYSDSGLFLFGLSLVIAAAAHLMSVTRLRIRRPFAWLAMLLVLAATIYNIFVSAKLFGIGITPVLSLLCVAFGGFEVFLQYRSLRPLPVAARA